MTFERPELLTLAPLLVLFVSLGVIAQWRRGLRLVEAFGGGEPASRLAARDLRRFPTGRLIGLVALGVALSAAAAGPGTIDPPGPSHRPLDLVVAVDVSLSMSATDVGMGRARRATEVVARLTEILERERIGVVVFADWPYTLVPPTDDAALIRFFTDSLSTDLVAPRDQGTSLATVVGHALASLESRRRPEAEPVILILTDGEAHEDDSGVLDSVAGAAIAGVQIWTARLGTDAGGELTAPGSEGEPLVDESGLPVVAGSDDRLLRDIAAAGSGRYYDLTDERGVRSLLDDLAGYTGSADEEGGGTTPSFWLALLGLPLLLWEGVADTGRVSRRTGREGSS